MTSKAGRSEFEAKYPNLYRSLKSVINNAEEKQFLEKLVIVYGIDSGPLSKRKRHWDGLLRSRMVLQHPLFQCLIHYPPFAFPLFHYYIAELEESLGNPRISFEKREQKTRALTKKDEFWNTYFELEVANSLAKQGCRVVVQQNIKRFDMKVSFNDGLNFNVEVTAVRLEKRDEATVLQNITRRIESKTEQLPRRGINIIVIAVPLGSSLLPFDIQDALYGSPVIKIIRTSDIGKRGFKGGTRSPLILETNPKLRNIGAVVSWSHCGIPLSMFGKHARLIIPYSRPGFPAEIKNVFLELNRQTRPN